MTESHDLNYDMIDIRQKSTNVRSGRIPYHVISFSFSYQTSRIVYRLHCIRAWAHFHTPHLRYVPDTANVVLLTDKLLRCMHQAIETCHDAKGR
jgi:hypothetical protein